MASATRIMMRHGWKPRHPLISKYITRPALSNNTRCVSSVSVCREAKHHARNYHPELRGATLNYGQTHRNPTISSRITNQRREFSQMWRCSSDASKGDEKGSETSLLQRINPVAVRRHENIYTIPNILTFTRLIAAPAVGYFIITSQPLYALCLFAYAGVTDAVDGYLARRFNQQTVVGTVIDPMADKLLMTISVIALAASGTFPLWLAITIIGRDVALAISAIYFRWISLPPPKTMARYWDFSLPSAEVHPTEISKINTLLQLLLLGNAMVLPVLPTTLLDAYNLQGVFEGWQFLVAGTTIWSGLSYIGNKDAVKILTEQEIKDQMEEKMGEDDKVKKDGL